ncbi:MAG: 2'-deoxycytidine 5'-triphosphate deaminase [Nanoarchaeota archaeon]|nr:2'-deoxycytidine 5'-triphosphate deaminase [Nanoarchaeota archaeon]
MLPNTTAADKDLLELINKNSIIIPIDSLNEAEREKVIKNIQPSSIDLRIGNLIWLMKGACRPMKNETVSQLLHNNSVKELELDDFLLLRDRVYVVKLQEMVNIQEYARIRTNAKSSSGRLDLQVRLLADHTPHYDSVNGPYQGELYAEISSNSFDCFLTSGGVAFNQMRYSLGNSTMPDDEIRSVLKTYPFLYTKNGERCENGEISIDGGLVLTLDLNGDHTNSEIIGYRAKRYGTSLVDIHKIAAHPIADFFDPIEKPKNKEITLEPGYFYLLSTNEAISLPPGFAGELAQFDSHLGHITSHYAGFFDPGWGYFSREEKQGNTATLEIRVHNKLETVRDGQPISVLRLERMAQNPMLIYGEKERKSHYARQIGVRYGKHFRE